MSGDSALIPVVDGAYAEVVLEVASDVGMVYDTRVIPWLSCAWVLACTQSNGRKAALTYLSSESRYTGEVAVSPDEAVADTLVGLTGEHDVTVLGATEDWPHAVPLGYGPGRLHKPESECTVACQWYPLILQA